MPRFIDRNDGQSTLISVCFDDYIRPGSFEYALHYLIEDKLDLSGFCVDLDNDETGRPAYHPATLLKVVLYGYSKGITSSRQLAAMCARHITFMCLASHTRPHWTTIAHFISAHPDAIADVFTQVLLVCDQQGLLGHELIAIDGCKLPSNAAKEWSGTLDQLTRKRDKLRRQVEQRLAEHQRLDEADETALAEREAKAVETLSKAADKIDRFLADAQPRQGTGMRSNEVQSNITDNESAKMKTSKGVLQGYTGVAAADEKHQIVVAAEAFGHGQEQHTLQPILEGMAKDYAEQGINEDLFRSGVVVTADTGYANDANYRYLHEHNIDAYIPDNQFRNRDPRFKDKAAHHGSKRAKHKARFSSDQFDYDPVAHTCSCPAGQFLRLKSIATDANLKQRIYFEGRLSQCSVCELRHQCMRNPESAQHRKGHGRQVSFLLEKSSKFLQWMQRRVDSVLGKRYYADRMRVIEPVFGNIEACKGLKRFSLRTKQKVNAQWQLFCLVHNIEKIGRYGLLPQPG